MPSTPGDGAASSRPPEVWLRQGVRAKEGARASSASAISRRVPPCGVAGKVPVRIGSEEGDGPRPPPRAAPLPLPMPASAARATSSGPLVHRVDADGRRRLGRAREEARCSSGPDVEEAGWTPLPPSAELEALIEQTAREIAELESQEQFWADGSDVDDLDRQRYHETAPLPSLTPLQAPAPPRIQRLGRESRLDSKWARLQRELADPIEISRAYLDRVCRPQPEPAVPYMVPKEVVDEVVDSTRNPWQNSIESLSYNPLEFHIKSLCRPW